MIARATARSGRRNTPRFMAEQGLSDALGRRAGGLPSSDGGKRAGGLPAALAAAAALCGCSGDNANAGFREFAPVERLAVADHIVEQARDDGDPLAVGFTAKGDAVTAFVVGAAALQFHHNAEDLFARPLDCRSVAADLDEAITPTAVLVAAESAQTSDLSELLVSEYAAVASVLARCADDDNRGAAYQWAPVEPHLIETGVRT